MMGCRVQMLMLQCLREAKGSYEFGVDAVSEAALTVTSKDTGSVDTLEGIETLSFDDGPLRVGRPSSDAGFHADGKRRCG